MVYLTASRWVLTILMFQYVVSATAGLVRQTRGEVNVKTDQIVTADATVETGDNGLADLQLNPGSYLRLRANSAAVFKSTSLNNIEFEVTQGHAMVDLDEDPPFPIKITAGAMVLQVRKAGVFGISPDSVTVFDGQVELSKGRILKKGQSAFEQSNRLQITRLSKDEIRHPFAPDQLKVFVQPKPDKDQSVPPANAMFLIFVQQNFKEIHDVEIVSKPEGADYVLTVAANLKSGIHRINGGAGIFVEMELKDSDGVVLFSNERDDSDNDFANKVTSGDLFLSGDSAAKQLIRYVTNKTGWR